MTSAHTQITQHELEAAIHAPPEGLSPVAGIMRTLKVNHDTLRAQLAGEELALSEQRQKVERLRAEEQRLKAQREVLAETWKQLFIQHKTIEARSR